MSNHFPMCRYYGCRADVSGNSLFCYKHTEGSDLVAPKPLANTDTANPPSSPTLSTQVDDTLWNLLTIAERDLNWTHGVNETRAALLALFDTYVQEIIGKDEDIHSRDPSGLRPWLLDVPAQLRNDFRAEQRLTAKELLG